MTVQEIAQGLHAEPHGKSFWSYCPVHEWDGKKHRPSLQITQGNDKILVRCWAGCDQVALIAKLRDLELWPREERLPYLVYRHLRQLRQFIADIDSEKEALLNTESCLALMLDKMNGVEGVEFREWTDRDWQRWMDLCGAQQAARSELEELTKSTKIG